MLASHCLSVCVFWFACADTPPEGTFQGKPISHWISALDDVATTTNAERTLREAKVQALPVLVVALEKGGFFSTKTAREILDDLGAGAVPDLAILLKDADPATRRRACIALAHLGATAQAAVPQLSRCLQDEDAKVREAALVVLGEVGPPARMAVPILLQALHDDTLPRPLAMLALGGIGPPARPAVPRLIELLEDEDKKTRCAAMLALGGIGRDAKLALPKILVAAKSKDRDVRLCAFDSLGGFGSDAAPAIPLLIASLKDRSHDDGTHSAAEQALGRIGEPAVPALIELLAVKDFEANWRATGSLVTCGRDAVLPLSKALTDKREQVRLGAARALGSLGTNAVDAIPALLVQYQRHNARADLEFRQTILKSLGEISPLDDRILDTLVRALGDKDLNRIAASVLGAVPDVPASVIPAAFDALRRMENTFFMGSPAELLAKAGPAAIPYLVRGLRDPDNNVRANSAQALGEMGGYALPVLRRALRDDAAETRSAACMSFETLSSENRRRLLPELRAMADDSSSKVRAAVAKCLQHMQGDDNEAITLLGFALHDQSPEVRRQAAGALAPFVRESTAVPRLLAHVLADRDDKVCEAAVTALQRCGPGGSAAVPALIRLVEDNRKEREDCRRKAIYVLESIGPEARAAVPALMAAYEAGYESAGVALGRIGPDARAAIPMLVQRVRRRPEPFDDDIRPTAAVALVRISQEESKLALPVLLRVLKSKWAPSKEDAIQALGLLGPEAKGAVPELLEILKNEVGGQRSRAIVSLGQIGPPAKGAAVELWKQLREKDLSLDKEDIVLALARIDAGPHADLQALVQALNNEDVYVRRYAANAFDLLGQTCKPALPALLNALHDKDPIVRFKAAKALGNLGPEARPATEALAGFLQNQEVFPVHFSAAYALVQIGASERGGRKLVEVLRAGNQANNVPAFQISFGRGRVVVRRINVGTGVRD